jgi:hypothetical protein
MIVCCIAAMVGFFLISKNSGARFFSIAMLLLCPLSHLLLIKLLVGTRDK